MSDEVDPQSHEGALAVSRRAVIGGAGLIAAVLAIPGTAEAALKVITSRSGSLVFSVRDRESMQRLTLSFANARVSGGRISASGSGAATMVVDLGPQALIEEITSGMRPPSPVDARLALSSRLAFTLPPAGLPATREGLLTWLECEPRVTSLGAYPAGERIPPADAVYRDPTATQIAIEIPWFMVLSPSDESGWDHPLVGPTRDGRTEVWQTRLATRTFDSSGDPTGYDHTSDTVRVVWLRDKRAARMLGTSPSGIVTTPGSIDYPFEMRPNPQDRSDIARLTGMTSNAAGSAAVSGGVADPVEVDLTLSALGGTMRAAGEWNEPGVASLTSWQQRTWDGRDTYIRTTRRGFVYPFAAPATLVEEVTREFLSDRSGTVRAFERLSQRVIINVPSIDLDGADGVPHEGRGAPFSRVVFRTRATPTITGVATPLGGEWNGAQVFVPELPGGEPFAFTLTGRDRAGHSITFEMPLLFAEDRAVGGKRANFTKTGSRALRTYYAGLPEAERRANMRGAYVGFAASADGSTSMPTASLDWHLDIGTPRGSSSDLARERRPYSFPRMERATINVDGASAMAGDSQYVDVSFPDVYLRDGIGGTELGIYLEGIGSQDVGAGAQRGGGISAPSMGVAGIGSITGVLPGAPGDLPYLSVAAPKINPASMLRGFTLFGGISLADLLPDPIDMLEREPSTGGWRPNPKAPAFATDRSFDVDLPDIPTEVFVRYEWRPELKVGSGLVGKLLPEADLAEFYILVEAKASALELDAYWKAEGALTNLQINFFGRKVFAYVILERIGFTAGSGRASDMQVEIGDVVFGDALAFLSAMSSFLSFGSGNGPILDIDADSITTGFSLALPEVGLGAVTLSGLATRVAINLPFGRDPVRLELGFSSPSDPFAVTVMGIGGGGWFGLDVGLDGVEYLNIGALIKAALELDLGVASGGVSCSFGLQYEISGVGSDTEMSLTAFLCIKGRVEVLGIVTIGIELCIGFTFPIPDPGERFKLIGQATCTVKVKVCGIKKSVRITVRRTVTGGVMPAAPSSRSARALETRADAITPVTFADVMTQTDWSEWCGAFA
ncbi:MAG: hypothetical protein FJW80_11550 [Actinobacteria bacterium]|nr:hypothetical protein [Actinomycetota bacterium]